MKDFIIDYVAQNSKSWKVKPQVVAGEELQDNVILVFGKPTTAIFAHIDSIGFTVRYENQLVPIGGPDVENGYSLVGKDSLGPIFCKLVVDEDHHLFYDFPRAIERGTTLTYEPYLKPKGQRSLGLIWTTDWGFTML